MIDTNAIFTHNLKKCWSSDLSRRTTPYDCLADDSGSLLKNPFLSAALSGFLRIHLLDHMENLNILPADPQKRGPLLRIIWEGSGPLTAAPRFHGVVCVLLCTLNFQSFLPQALEEGWEQHLQHFISIDELRGLPRISHGCVQQLVQRNDSQQRIPAIEPDGLHGSLHGRVRGHWDVRLFQLSLRLHSAVPVMSAEIEGVQGAEAAQLVDPCAVWIEHTLANRFVPVSLQEGFSFACLHRLAAGVLISRHEALNGISCQRDVRDELRRLQLPFLEAVAGLVGAGVEEDVALEHVLVQVRKVSEAQERRNVRDEAQPRRRLSRESLGDQAEELLGTSTPVQAHHGADAKRVFR
mmetsp:Transcript_8858/g.33451  ORF Transcript_8858/g.33451 Transcript_8858/m.33451 type:complete len:352 (-) Transcript_8858:301-1356(-)